MDYREIGRRAAIALVLVAGMALECGAGEFGEFGRAGLRFLDRLKAAEARPEPVRRGRASESGDFAIPTTAPVQREEDNKGKPFHAVLLVGDKESSGSAFIARLWGVPVMITNAHVLADMRSPEIGDLRQNKIEPRAILISKTRDIAIAEIDVPAWMPILELAPRIEELPLRTGLIAYGDSLGGGVVTEAKGFLKAIGPMQIEISCPVVPGNSGGPVVMEDGRVAGVATFLTVAPDLNALYRQIQDGERPSRSATKNAPMTVRRYALRLDHLTTGEFEVFDPKLQSRDLDAYRELTRINRLFLKDLAQQEEGLGARLHFFREYAKLPIDWEAKPSLKYLSPLLKRARTDLCTIAAVCGMPVMYIRPKEAEKAEMLYRLLDKGRRGSFRCTRCGGTGEVTAMAFRVPSMADRRERRERVPGVERSLSRSGSAHRAVKQAGEQVLDCPDCKGKANAEVPYYELTSGELSGRLSYVKLPGELPALGAAKASIAKRIDPERQAKKIEFNGIFEYWETRGNPAWPRVLETRYGFMAGYLAAVSMRFARSRDTWEMLAKQLEEELGKPVARGRYEETGYIFWQKHGYAAAMIATAGESGKEPGNIRVVFRHNELTELGYLVQESLAGRDHSATPEMRRPTLPRETIDRYL